MTTDAKKFELLPHTADLRVRVFGATLEELFQHALEALMTTMGEGMRRTGPAEPQMIHMQADSATNLLVDFLSEALYLANVEKAIYDRAHFEALSQTELRATLTGQAVDSFAEDIKAVTYHGAEIKRSERGQFGVEIVFDI